jgi:AcrR family transcriptional regulator
MARTPSLQAHASVLAGALELFCESGIDATSMDAIAEKSGVSKATIYKHWPDKSALCLDVLARLHEVDSRPAFDSGDIRADLEAVLSYRPSAKVSEQQNRMMPHLIAYAARNKAFGDAWRARVMEPPIRQITHLLKRGAKQGLLNDLDPILGAALLLGPMMFRKIFPSAGKELPVNLEKLIVDAFWKAHVAPLANRSANPGRNSKRSKRSSSDRCA